MLVGRIKEVGALEDVLAAVRDGLSGVLVLRGEMRRQDRAVGLGATAAGDMRVARVAGVESEMDLGFAGLHQRPVLLLDGLDRLPAPAAGGTSVGVRAGGGAAAGPVPGRARDADAAHRRRAEPSGLCVVDNAQWLDRASAEVLGFVARRLLADRVGMLFAVEGGEERAVVFKGLPELLLSGRRSGRPTSCLPRPQVAR